MAESINISTGTAAEATPSKSGDSQSTPPVSKPRQVPLPQLYALPAPIKTFPLPSFYPSNPLSIIHVAYKWLSYTFYPPPSEPSIIIDGVWDAKTRSVHVKDEASMRILWEQGFFGKGSLSRSEPNWMKREYIRRGVTGGDVSEQRTVSRREERKQAKWERARIEQETIERTLAEEAISTSSVDKAVLNGHAVIGNPPRPPVGPLELLLLPNSSSDLRVTSSEPEQTIALPNGKALAGSQTMVSLGLHATDALLLGMLGPSEETTIPNQLTSETDAGNYTHMNGHSKSGSKLANGSTTSTSTLPLTNGSIDEKMDDQPLRRRKSVRFSPQVESTTFECSDPPSPNHSNNALKISCSPLIGEAPSEPSITSKPLMNGDAISTSDLPNKEHLQLSPEEAFYLVFAIGALRVSDAVTNQTISTPDLLTLFRSYSHFPPLRQDQLSNHLQPQDPFLIHYAVYHHFRSLGWVPRHGIKFGVDWLLYQRGPVFDHAEFGVVVLPSFSHPWWNEHGHISPRKSWHWLNGIIRVLSHVMKSLVLVYVDVPPPPVFDEAIQASNGGIAAAMKQYKIREVMARRWSSNRNR
jgi:tRNA-splicing endonuclease subunit Sen2